MFAIHVKNSLRIKVSLAKKIAILMYNRYNREIKLRGFLLMNNVKISNTIYSSTFYKFGIPIIILLQI